ncbi:hypothetical protein M427DRAFT_444336 [Gonapodya prolifera JEL478]|uniref:Uncharacterized protein n=1 Tax=Gonapodya prolifera (strain JEL478) TaxID=1344416 RepID=A0A139A424_GONPJ|nr:hypothetical protein M427DRAFT_444336 [Gonapodya prolifera JEL478]|eukprot:KXS11215.1 hypothetical protein M427DRAFT_444336 [Gonapodya prolifera JEL478]
MDDAFCRDFSCCGMSLASLHDLVQHCEEFHGGAFPEEQEDEATTPLAAGLLDVDPGAVAAAINAPSLFGLPIPSITVPADPVDSAINVPFCVTPETTPKLVPSDDVAVKAEPDLVSQSVLSPGRASPLPTPPPESLDMLMFSRPKSTSSLFTPSRSIFPVLKSDPVLCAGPVAPESIRSITPIESTSTPDLAQPSPRTTPLPTDLISTLTLTPFPTLPSPPPTPSVPADPQLLARLLAALNDPVAFVSILASQIAAAIAANGAANALSETSAMPSSASIEAAAAAAVAAAGLSAAALAGGLGCMAASVVGAVGSDGSALSSDLTEPTCVRMDEICEDLGCSSWRKRSGQSAKRSLSPIPEDLPVDGLDGDLDDSSADESATEEPVLSSRPTKRARPSTRTLLINSSDSTTAPARCPPRPPQTPKDREMELARKRERERRRREEKRRVEEQRRAARSKVGEFAWL